MENLELNSTTPKEVIWFENIIQDGVHSHEIERCLNENLTSNERKAIVLRFGLEGEKLTGQKLVKRMRMPDVIVGLLIMSGLSKLSAALSRAA